MVEYGGLRILVGELGVLPDDIRRDLRKGLREAGEAALNQARANASWSSRIPGAMSLRVYTSGPRTGVSLRVDSSKAPHARPYEGIGGRGDSFRHPVFGGDAWVSQSIRPFLAPAAAKVRAQVMAAAEQAIANAARRLST